MIFQALVLAVAVEHGPCGSAASTLLPSRQQDEDSYHARAYTILDLSLPELLADFPQLQGMEPAAGQEKLPVILSEAGASVEQLYHNLTSVVADELVTQEQCDHDGRVKSSRRLRFGYLILVNHDGLSETLEEYRTDAAMKPVETAGAEEEFNVTNNFASLWLLFYPENQPGTDFRYLGQQDSSGRTLYVVGFAERSDAPVRGRLIGGGRSAILLYQGVVWIDASSFRIARMRLDLLEPQLDLGVERSTTEIGFGEVRIPQAAATLWLPEEVTVSTIYYGQMYRNRHLYSHFRLFNVKSTIKPLKPLQQHSQN